MVDFNQIINLRYNRVKPASGRILISDPFQSDQYFERSVVVLIDHNSEGTMGVVINKPISEKISLKFDEIYLPELQIYQGGPVASSQLFFMHCMGDVVPDSIALGNDLYWGGSLDTALELFQLNILNKENTRFFWGYAGWSKSQLKEELKRNSWLIASINGETLFKTEPNKLWKKSIQHLGDDYLAWLTLPIDPAMN
jgi:putative transcriptional regulator